MTTIFLFCGYLVWRIKDLQSYRYLVVNPFFGMALYSLKPGATYGLAVTAALSVLATVCWLWAQRPLAAKWEDTRHELLSAMPLAGDQGKVVVKPLTGVWFLQDGELWAATWVGTTPPLSGSEAQVVGVEGSQLYLAPVKSPSAFVAGPVA